MSEIQARVSRLALPAEQLRAGPAPESPWFSQKALAGHSLKMLRSGPEICREKLDQIRQAKRSVYVSTYLIDGTRSGRDLARALCEKAGQGLDVRFLVDHSGSSSFKQGLDQLRSCGVRVVTFATRAGWSLSAIPYGMHEKLVITDGQSLLIGGSNFTDKFCDGTRQSGKDTQYDLDVSVRGPAACRFQKIFEKTWQESAHRHEAKRYNGITTSETMDPKLRERLYGHNSWVPCVEKADTRAPAGGAQVLPLYGNPLFDKKSKPILEAHLRAIRESKKEIRLYSPFLIPLPELNRALIDARRRGVKVTIVTNSPKSHPEVPIATAASYLSIGDLLQAGVEIRMWDRLNTFHRKGGIFDGKLAYFGSDNLDRRATDYNTESIIYTNDPSIVSQFAREMDEDLQQTVPLTVEHIREWLAQQPSLRKKLAKFGRKWM